MDSIIAAERLAELELQAAAALGPPRESAAQSAAAEPSKPTLTVAQRRFLLGRKWFRNADGTIVVVHDGPIVGPIPRGIICRPGSNKTLRRRHAR